jgi:hypothetical protein
MWPLSLATLLRSGLEAFTLVGWWFYVGETCNLQVNDCLNTPVDEMIVRVSGQIFLKCWCVPPSWRASSVQCPFSNCGTCERGITLRALPFVFSGAGHFLSEWPVVWGDRTLVCHTRGICVSPLLISQAWNRTMPVKDCSIIPTRHELITEIMLFFIRTACTYFGS